jgi:hypothetical protein
MDADKRRCSYCLKICVYLRPSAVQLFGYRKLSRDRATVYRGWRVAQPEWLCRAATRCTITRIQMQNEPQRSPFADDEASCAVKYLKYSAQKVMETRSRTRIIPPTNYPRLGPGMARQWDADLQSKNRPVQISASWRRWFSAASELSGDIAR